MKKPYVIKGLPHDLIVGNTYYSRRLAVDSQQTSFEEGVQFKYFDQLTDIDSGDQVVYYISTVNDINIFKREFSVRSGGREYLVYPDDGTHTFTGTLVDSGRISPVASQHYDDSNPTEVTIQRAVGDGIFTAGNDPTIGTMAVADTNVNRATPVYSSDGTRAGLSGGSGAYIVLNHIGSNDDTIGQYALYWEERFDD